MTGDASDAGLRHPDAFSRGTPPRCTKMIEFDPSRTPGGIATIDFTQPSLDEALVWKRQDAPQNVDMATPEVTIATGGRSSIVLGEDAPEQAFIRQKAPQNVEMTVPEVTIATGGQSSIVLGSDALEEAFVRQEAPQNVEMIVPKVPIASGGVPTTMTGDASDAGLRHPDAFSRGTPPRCTKMIEFDPSRTPGGIATIDFTQPSLDEALVWKRQDAPQNVEMTVSEITIATGGQSTITFGDGS